MLDWISHNNTLVNSLTNLGTLAIWLFYAHLLYRGYSRQRRPRMLINKGVGSEFIDSPCLVCNMSQEAVYLFFVVVRLKTSEGLYTAPMTDCYQQRSDGEKPTLWDRTRQGPVKSGDCLEFMNFRDMIDTISRQEGIETENGYPCDPDIDLKWIEIHVVSIYGSDNAPFGATRRFGIHVEDETREVELRPTTLDTTQQKSWRYRRQIRRWLKEYQ